MKGTCNCVYVGLVIRSGSLNEKKSGTAHILEHMIINGRLINENRDIVFNNRAITDFGYTIYYLDIKKDNITFLFNFLTDIYREKILCRDDFLHSKKEVWDEYNEISETFKNKKIVILFEKTTLGLKMPLGDKNILEVSFEDVCEYFEKFYGVQNTALILCGNINVQEQNNIKRIIDNIGMARQICTISQLEPLMFNKECIKVYANQGKCSCHFVINNTICDSDIDYVYTRMLENYALIILEEYIETLVPSKIRCRKEYFNSMESFLVIEFIDERAEYLLHIIESKKYMKEDLRNIINIDKYIDDVKKQIRYGINMNIARQECIQHYIYENRVILLDNSNTILDKAAKKLKKENVTCLLEEWYFKNNNYRFLY